MHANTHEIGMNVQNEIDKKHTKNDKASDLDRMGLGFFFFPF